MNLQSTDFELFELATRFVQDPQLLDARWKDLQRQAHPDRFAAQGAAAQRVALQWSVRINEAYQRLRDPLRRAAYLCELHGAPVNAQNNTTMPMQFLQQQVGWREALDDAASAEALAQLEAEVRRSQAQGLLALERLLDLEQDFPAAVAQVRGLMFFQRFLQDLHARAERMETAGSAQGGSGGRGQ